MRPPSFVLCVLVLAALEFSRVQCFSAQLSRPWEGPLTSSANLARRRRRWEDSLLQSAPVSQDREASDGELTGESSHPDDEEQMTLQTHNDTSHAVLWRPTHSIQSSSPDTTPTKEPKPTVRSSWKQLFGMTRPSNFYGVVLLHILGAHLALQNTNAGNAQLLSTLAHPSMVIVLLSLLLTSATSMVVNDYFDHKMGVDAQKFHKPLVQGTVSADLAKRFLYYLYGGLLISLTIIPGIPARLEVVLGIMLTYWYTTHLKPITWLKNIVCASLIALSPSTSAAAAFALTSDQSPFKVFLIPELGRLIGMLFIGFIGREMLMDINDMAEDMLHEVQTVPVVYGQKFASNAAFVCTAAMAAAAWMGPIGQLLQSGSWTNVLATLRASPGGVTRKLILASLGNLAMLRRGWEVVQTEGEDRDVVERAIEEGKLTFMFLLASFV